MPGLMTMKPVGAVSKSRSSSSRALARVKTERSRDDRAAGTPTSLLRMHFGSAAGHRPAQLQASGLATIKTKVFESVANKVRTNLVGDGAEVDSLGEYVSSGSEHEPSSVCLAAMVDEFIEEQNDSRNGGRSRYTFDDCSYALSTGDEDSKSSLGGELADVLCNLTPCINVTERILLAEVNKVVTAAKEGTCAGGGITLCLRRQVMKCLRSAGYNAAISKSRWDHSGGCPGGNYEYIDVVFEGTTGKSERFLIDVDFKSQFEIARPTAHYDALVQALPSIFVGKADRLQQIVILMSDAVKLSLKKRGMHLPPWRKPEYMRAKWFASYRRTINDALSRDEVSDSSQGSVRSGSFGACGMDEMESESHKPEGRPVMKELKNLVDDRLPVVTGNKRTQEAFGPLRSTIDNNDWQPPLLKPRMSQRPEFAGLASLFREAGLNAAMKEVA